MSLKEVVANAKSNKKTDHTSGKNPQFYSEQARQCISEACSSPIIEVRIHMAGSQFTPTNNLKTMLKEETERDVLSALVQNERLPVKSLEAFAESEQGEIFTPEDEAYQFIQTRLGVEAEA